MEELIFADSKLSRSSIPVLTHLVAEQVSIDNVHFRYLDHASYGQPVVLGLCVRRILIPAANKGKAMGKAQKQKNRVTKTITVSGVNVYNYMGDSVRSGCFFSADWSDNQFKV